MHADQSGAKLGVHDLSDFATIVFNFEIQSFFLTKSKFSHFDGMIKFGV
jgi:hypothetical protein